MRYYLGDPSSRRSLGPGRYPLLKQPSQGSLPDKALSWRSAREARYDPTGRRSAGCRGRGSNTDVTSVAFSK
jgi:hypothetical protein